jgi:hypothetical protein
MAVLRSVLSLCLVLTALLPVAQTTPGVKLLYAFITEHQPGNIPIDPANGHPLHAAGPDTLYTIYIETSGPQPVYWYAAWQKDETYSIHCSRVEKTPVEAGITKTGREKIMINASEGSTVWRLDLFPADKNLPLPADLRKGEIILQGMRANKKLVLQVSKLVELAAIPSV